MSNTINGVKPDAITSDDIARQTAAFLKRGGRVEHVSVGMSGAIPKKRLTRDQQKARDFSRREQECDK